MTSQRPPGHVWNIAIESEDKFGHQKKFSDTFWTPAIFCLGPRPPRTAICVVQYAIWLRTVRVFYIYYINKLRAETDCITSIMCP